MHQTINDVFYLLNAYVIFESIEIESTEIRKLWVSSILCLFVCLFVCIPSLAFGLSIFIHLFTSEIGYMQCALHSNIHNFHMDSVLLICAHENTLSVFPVWCRYSGSDVKIKIKLSASNVITDKFNKCICQQCHQRTSYCAVNRTHRTRTLYIHCFCSLSLFHLFLSVSHKLISQSCFCKSFPSHLNVRIILRVCINSWQNPK